MDKINRYSLFLCFALTMAVMFISFTGFIVTNYFIHVSTNTNAAPEPTPTAIATPTSTPIPEPTVNPLKEDLEYYAELSTNFWHQIQDNNIIIANLEESIRLSETNPLYTQNAYGIPITEEDFTYLCRMAETETYDAPLSSKMNVISVALNRVKQGWGLSPMEVIISPNQFAYYREEISDSTKAAVLMVLVYGDTAQEAVYFHNKKYKVGYFEKYDASYLFTDAVGHSFYVANSHLLSTLSED